MALSITCSKITQDGAGRIHVAFSDGVELEFTNRAAALDWGRPDDGADDATRLLLRQLLMMWWLKRDPTGAAPATVVGHSITADLTQAANILVVA